MTSTTKLVKVSRKAVHARIRRRLAREGQFVRTNRNRVDRRGESDYWIVDAPRGHKAIVKGGFDEAFLESFARELGVLKPTERLVID